MKEKWHDTEGLDESLGEDLDLDLAWAEFEQEKEKKRPILFWLWPSLGACLLLVSSFGMYHFFRNKEVTQIPSDNLVIRQNIDVLSDEVDQSGFQESDLPFPVQNFEIDKHNQKDIITKLYPSSVEEKNLSQTAPRQEIIRLNNEIELKLNLGRERSYFTPTEESTNQLVAIPTTNKSLNEVRRQKSIYAEHLARKAIWESPFLSKKLSLLDLEKDLLWTPNPMINTKKTIQNNWKLGFLYTIGKSRRTLSGKNQPYIERRNNGENFKEFQSIDFTLSRQLTRLIYVQTGLSVNQYRSKFVDQIQVLKSPVTYDNVIIETRTKNNITEEVTGTAFGSQLTLLERTRFQRYQSIALPVTIGLRFPIANTWHFSVGTGMAVSLNHQFQGATYSSILPDGNYIPLSNLGYKKAGLLEGLAQLEIEKHWRNNWHFQLGLQARSDLNNRLKNKNLGQDRFSSYGVQVGVLKSF